MGNAMRIIGITAFLAMSSMTWPAHSEGIPNPLVGRSYEQKLSETRWWTMKVEPAQLTFVAMAGEKKGQVVLTVPNPIVTEVSEDVYLLRWQEENKATAVHVINLKRGIEYFSATRPDGTFVMLEGTVKEVR